MTKVLFKYPRPNTSVYVPTAKYGKRMIVFGADCLYATDDEEEIAALMNSKAVRIGRAEEESAEEVVQEAEPKVEEKAEPPKKVVKRTKRSAARKK